MSLHDLQEKIEATITNWSSEMKRDLKAAMALAQIGGEQPAFTDWLIDKTIEKQKDGWWKPMCLFRSYNTRLKDPGKEESNRIRAEIRAVMDAEPPCPFLPIPLNRKENKEIFKNWLSKNINAIADAYVKNAGSFSTTTTLPTSQNEPADDYYEPTFEEDFVPAYKQLQNTTKEGQISEILEQMAKNLAGKPLKDGWERDMLKLIEIKKR